MRGIKVGDTVISRDGLIKGKVTDITPVYEKGAADILVTVEDSIGKRIVKSINDFLIFYSS